jgi:hypothetical protein
VAQRPVAIGLLLCEQIIVEEGTHNVTPVNCFRKWFVDSIPSEPVSLKVFALLTNGSGNVRVLVRVEALETGEVIYEQPLVGDFRDPLQEARCIWPFHGLSFRAAGCYDVVLLAEREVIAQRKLQIILKGKKHE